MQKRIEKNWARSCCLGSLAVAASGPERLELKIVQKRIGLAVAASGLLQLVPWVQKDLSSKLSYGPERRPFKSLIA